MIKASDLQPGQTYRPTRRTPGLPNTYYLVIEEARARRLRKRLERKPLITLRGDEGRALADLRAGCVLLDVFHRYTDTHGKRIEYRTRLGLNPDEPVRLRAVRSKPGYVTR